MSKPFLLAVLIAAMPATGSAQSLGSTAAQKQATPVDLTLTGPLRASDLPERFQLLFLNAEYRDETDTVSVSRISEELRKRGRLTLSGATLNMQEDEPTSYGFDELRLSNSHVFLNGARVRLFVRRLVVDQLSSFQSFQVIPQSPSGNWRQLVSTTAGFQEFLTAENYPGADAGVLQIYVTGEIVGLPKIRLEGGRGGQGARGKRGMKGEEGPRGRNADGGLAWCNSGPGAGGPGQPGGKGGPGYPGGKGGKGGSLEITYLNRPLQAGIEAYFESVPGAGGPGGDGGPGGPGGDGGRGGGNSPTCTYANPETNRGPTGPTGPTGDRGREGPRGDSGRGVIKSEQRPD